MTILWPNSSSGTPTCLTWVAELLVLVYPSAERFGVPMQVTEVDKKKARAARFGLSEDTTASTDQPPTKKQRVEGGSVVTASVSANMVRLKLVRQVSCMSFVL